MNIVDRIWRSSERDGWIEMLVVGETQAAWYVNRPRSTYHWDERKIRKADFVNGQPPAGWALSLAQTKQLGWVPTIRFSIGERAVGRICAWLQAIEKLLNEADARR